VKVRDTNTSAWCRVRPDAIATLWRVAWQRIDRARPRATGEQRWRVPPDSLAPGGAGPSQPGASRSSSLVAGGRGVGGQAH